MLEPEGLVQLWGVVGHIGRRPLLKGRERDALRLRGAVGPCAGLREVLLVVVFRVVEDLARVDDLV